VVQASSGPEALRVLREGPVDIVVTDYLMPAMNGVELVHEAQRLLPGLPALLVTGYCDIAAGPGSELPRLTKPFRQVELARRVAELLRRAPGGKVVAIRREAKPERRED
jgi:CheY-like chemotaxis protein